VAERSGRDPATAAADPFAETVALTPEFWRLLGLAVLVGAATGAFALVFLGLVHLAENLVFPGEAPTGWFDGPLWLIPLMGGAGVVVGLLRRRFGMPAGPVSVFDEMEEGRVEPRHVPGTITISLASLAAAAPLGPEAAIGSAGGGMATWASERRGDRSPGHTAAATFAGISGAFGALVSPFVAPLLALELERPTRFRYLTMIIPGIAAASAGFAVVYMVAGELFIDLYKLPGYEFRVWHMLAAVGLGVVGGLVALVAGVVLRGCRELGMRPAVAERPVLRATVGGLCVGAILVVLPLTLYSGIDQLDTVFADAATLGVGLLIATVLAKMLGLGIALGSGFIGGPIFPLLFIGGTSGAVIAELIPELPAVVAAASMMAAVAGGIMKIPIALIFMVALIFGLGAVTAVPIGIATLTSFLLVQGVVVGLRSRRDSARGAHA